MKKIIIIIKNVTYISRKFVYNLQTFRGICQVHFYGFLANSAWKILYLPISYREAPCGKRISRVPPVFLFFFAPWIYHFTDKGCWNSLYNYLNQGRKIVFNFKVTTWRCQTLYIPDYFLGFQTSAKQSSVETKEVQVSLNSLHCLFFVLS